MIVLSPEQVRAARARVEESVRVASPEDPDSCWIGVGKPRPNGYVRIRFEGKLVYLHRLAYLVWRGPIKAKFDIRHQCGNRACARPEHLASGSRLATMTAAKKRGTLSRGLAHALHARGRGKKLDWEKVHEIRRRLAAGERASDVALDFHVDKSNVWAIGRQKIWRTGLAALLPVGRAARE